MKGVKLPDDINNRVMIRAHGTAFHPFESPFSDAYLPSEVCDICKVEGEALWKEVMVEMGYAEN